MNPNKLLFNPYNYNGKYAIIATNKSQRKAIENLLHYFGFRWSNKDSYMLENHVPERIKYCIYFFQEGLYDCCENKKEYNEYIENVKTDENYNGYIFLNFRDFNWKNNLKRNGFKNHIDFTEYENSILICKNEYERDILCKKLNYHGYKPNNCDSYLEYIKYNFEEDYVELFSYYNGDVFKTKKDEFPKNIHGVTYKGKRLVYFSSFVCV